jgi:hypothetical protein
MDIPAFVDSIAGGALPPGNSTSMTAIACTHHRFLLNRQSSQTQRRAAGILREQIFFAEWTP